MNGIEKQIEELEFELAQKDEYIEQCYVCGGFMLRKYAQNKRIVTEPRVLITAETEQQDMKTKVRIEGDEFKKVYVCMNCEQRLKNGEIILDYSNIE